MDLPFDWRSITVMGFTPVGWGVLIVSNIPIYILLAWVWFQDLGGFLEAIKYYLTPNIISALRDEYEDDTWATLKLGLWAVSCVVAVYFEADFIRYMLTREG